MECRPVLWVDINCKGTVRPCNWLFETFPDEPFYGFIADDQEPRSERWHDILAETASQTPCIAICDDLASNPKDRVGNCYAINGDLCRAAGFFMPPWVTQKGMDGIWTRAARNLDLFRYHNEVKVENMLWKLGKREYDDINRISSDHAHKMDTRKEKAFQQTLADYLEKQLPEKGPGSIWPKSERAPLE